MIELLVHSKRIGKEFEEIENRLYKNPNLYDETYQFRDISFACKLKKNLILFWKRLYNKSESEGKEQLAHHTQETEKEKLIYKIKRQSELRQRC